MSWIILNRPHPLDAIWSHAMVVVDEAQTALEELPEPYTNDEIDALVDRHVTAALAVIALPARNVADCIYKLDLTGPLEAGPMAGCDRAAIVTEALSLIDAGISRGAKLKALNPEYLDGAVL